MGSKKEIENDIGRLKKQLSELSTKNVEIKRFADTKPKAKDSTSQMFLLLKYMIEENKKTTMLLKHISDSLVNLEDSLEDSHYEEEQIPNTIKQPNQLSQVKELMLSEIDTKILQLIQISHNSMVCADEVREQMNYKGRNAASSRLNRLYKLGIVDRYQLGHKVYYKFDVGKTTKISIVTPKNR